MPVHHAKVTLIAMTPIASIKGAPTYTHQDHAMTKSGANTVTAYHARVIAIASQMFASMARAAIKATPTQSGLNLVMSSHRIMSKCKPLSLKLLLAWPQALSY